MEQVKIINKYMDSVEWINASVCTYLIQNNVDTWKINVQSNLLFIDNFLNIMAPAEIVRANRYLRADGRNRSIIARGALRLILGKYLDMAPADIKLGADKNKKPLLVNEIAGRLHFNASHSGDWILLAFSNSEIGADIEFIDPQFHYQDILSDYFSEEEVKYIRQNQSDERFFKLWTRKESLTKATGTGLDSELKYFPALDGQHLCSASAISSPNSWLTRSFKLNDSYVASVTSNRGIEEIRFWETGF